MTDYKTVDEPLSDPKEKFKVQCFNQVEDKALQSLKTQFEQQTKTLSCLDFCAIFKIRPKKMCCGFGKDFNLFEISPCSKRSHNENG